MRAVADMNETIAFYQKLLGFAATMKSSEYSMISRDGQTTHFMNGRTRGRHELRMGHSEIYIEVSGIHALWKHGKTLNDRFRVRELFERDCAITEFHIGDPNECLLFAGEPTSRSKTIKSLTHQPDSAGVDIA